tara:strand:- start:18323 stop:19243 length:921 start_codon:yes stop_codon:yes gene_type:complete
LISHTLIVNAGSSSLRSERVIRESEDQIHRALPNCEIIYVYEPEELIPLSSHAAKTSSVVIACGGDGTAQSVARGVYGSDAIMGLIPLGSGNDFAKSIGLKTNKPVEYYLNIIQQQQIIAVDVPIINDQIFINTAGIGFDGLTNYYASQSTFLKGEFKYTYAGLKSFLSAKKFELSGSFDEQMLSKKIWMVAVANGSTEGGKYLISPDSNNSDGILELVIVPGYSLLKLLTAFLWMSFGNSLGNRFSEVIRFKEGTFKLSKEQRIHLDGEVAESDSDFSVSIQNKNLSVIGIATDEQKLRNSRSVN